MADPSSTSQPPEGGSDARLETAAREAHDEAAPFEFFAAGLLVVLALLSKHNGWELLGRQLWWFWLVVAAPYVCLALTLVLGLGRKVGKDRRRELVLVELVVVWVFNLLGITVLVASLMAHSGANVTGRQLLLSGAVVWLTDVVAFGLVFWEVDCGGPVARALSTAREQPDFQFPQDENPELARDGWSPRLWDYLYISLTNSVAFSPTDAMPLTHRAKAFMAAESTLSAVTILLIAARAVNILG